MAFWERGDFVVENYLSGRQSVISPLVAHLLQDWDAYCTDDDAYGRLAALPNVTALTEELIAQDVLVVEGSALDAKDRLVEATWPWKEDARYFHFSTQRVEYEHDAGVQHDYMAELARRVPAPSPFKEYGYAEVRLPGTFQDPTTAGDFWDVLRARRTRRSFRREPVPLPLFATLLLWTWGPTHVITDPDVGQYVLKTSPSGGARHPIEVYPVVLRVDGVEPGIYHYATARHALQLLRPGLFEDLVLELCAHHSWVRDAAAVCLMTAVLARTMWKYPDSHAYRVLLLDAGHLGQTFHLVCAKLGLAPFTIAATDDPAIERALGLDGVSEVPLYTAVVGLPA